MIFRLTIHTYSSLTDEQSIVDVNGRLHSLTKHHVAVILIVGWTSFIMSWIFNIAYYKVHPSAVDFNLKRARARLFIYLLGYKINLPGYLECWQLANGKPQSSPKSKGKRFRPSVHCHWKLRKVFANHLCNLSIKFVNLVKKRLSNQNINVQTRHSIFYDGGLLWFGIVHFDQRTITVYLQNKLCQQTETNHRKINTLELITTWC